MSLYNPKMQENPDEPIDFEKMEFVKKVDRVIQAVERNKGMVHRWFWKCLLAFNLILGSIVLWLVVLHWF